MRKILAFVLLIVTPVSALAGDGWIDKTGANHPVSSEPTTPY